MHERGGALDAIAAAQERVAALGRARGQEGLRAAIAGVHAMARLTLALTSVNPIEGYPNPNPNP